MNAADLDVEIRTRVQAQVAEKAARRARMKQRRRDLDQRRQAGLRARHRAKLARDTEGNA